MTFDTSLVTYDGLPLPVIGMTFDGVPITGPYVAPVTAADIAQLLVMVEGVPAAVLAAAAVAPIHSDLRRAVGQPYHGDGSEGNKLRSTLVP